jgi:hypothetical protein
VADVVYRDSKNVRIQIRVSAETWARIERRHGAGGHALKQLRLRLTQTLEALALEPVIDSPEDAAARTEAYRQGSRGC